MASNYTEKYGLCQWEATDAVLRTDFNEDNQKIDAALKTQAGNISNLTAQMAGKASTATVSGLSTAISKKANQSDLLALTDRVAKKAEQSALNNEESAREAADTALAQSHANDVATLRKENCWVKLAEKDIASNLTSVSMDLSQFSMEDFDRLELTYSLSSSTASALKLQINGQNDAIYVDGSGSGRHDMSLSTCINLTNAITNGAGGTAAIMPGGNAGIAVTSHAMSRDGNSMWAGTCTGLISGISFEQLTSIQLSCGTIKAGSRFVVLGLKK